jgi:hypothetical protein
VESTAAALARVNAFGRAVKPDLPAVEVALADLRAMLARAGVQYALVGGLAVIHHGYVRTTKDIDVLLDRDDATRILPLLDGADFEPSGQRRWRHRTTGVDVDLLFAGEPMPREQARYPHPADVGRSRRESDIVDLATLMNLKLQAGRHRDTADVVELLQDLDEGTYLGIEATLPPHLRPRLFQLRLDALEERRWRERGG